MTVAQCQQEAVMNENAGMINACRTESDAKHLLMFDTGHRVYSIDLAETMDVIRDLMMIQSCNAKSITRHFIKFNRRHTIVFNLDQCLSYQDGQTGHRPASFVMLEGKINDSCVGILVPGIRSVTTRERVSPASRAQKNQPSAKAAKAQARTKTMYGKKGKKTESVLNLRELVDNYLLHLKYMDSRNYLNN